VYRELGDDIFAARSINAIAHAALTRHDTISADQLAREALTSAWKHGEREGVADCMDTLAAVAAAVSEPERAATLAGAAAAIRATITYQPSPFESAITGPFVERAQRESSPEEWTRWWRAGHELDADTGVAYALQT
jgi:hypothetical protein